MRKHLAALCAILLVCGSGMAVDLNIGNSTSSYAAQTAIGAFNGSVRDRMDTVRVGDLFLTGFSSRGRYAGIASDNAYGAAPSTRAASASRSAYGYEGQPRRQLECVYTSGFSVWGDVYGAWERQKSKSDNVGYKYRVGGPAVGFDWTSGGLTLGIATTYSWGTIKNVGGSGSFGFNGNAITHNNKNDRDTRTWGLMAYGQYNARRWYVNATLGYGQTKYKSSADGGGTFSLANGRQGAYSVDLDDRYRNKSWNADIEFGMKFRFGRGFLLTPTVGLQYFYDRRKGVNETGTLSYARTDNGNTGVLDLSMRSGSKNYYALDLPLGVNLAYEIAAGSAIIVPQLRFAWIPEIARQKGRASGTLVATERPGTWGSTTIGYSDHAARRSRNAFQIGLGAQAKLNQYVSLHLDYDVTLRSKYYNHNLNLGLGVTF